ncbi:MAG: hypothetical protein QM791_02830 [Ferruginibacter sp.]
MKYYLTLAVSLLFNSVINQKLQAQQYNCTLKPPIVNIDFGDDSNPEDMELLPVRKFYKRVKHVCPDDGHYSFVSHTEDCFFGNWIDVYRDHTPGSTKGRMMLVNAAYAPGPFFATIVNGLDPNKTYEFSAWFVNVCKYGQGCDPTPPVINVKMFYNGIMLSQFHTGQIAPTGAADWKRCAGMFTTPPGPGNLLITMEDLVNGGCGNDFAMDDIQIRECEIPKPEEKAPAPEPKPVVSKPAETKPVARPVEKAVVPEPVIPQKNNSVINKETVDKKPVAVKPVIKAQPNPVPVPSIFKTRDNPIVQKIETTSPEITVDLYDNGEIDGDTVTIYHNNALVIAHAGLSAKPVTLKIKVDENNPHHELVMVADNLGSIPPNTSLMIVTTKEKRYEVFISSSEQKNAKVVIDWKQDN